MPHQQCVGGLQGAKDFRVDADLHAACQADADQVCKDVEPGEGRVQDCLVSSQAAGLAACLLRQGSSALQGSMLAHTAAEGMITSRQASARLRALAPAAIWGCQISLLVAPALTWLSSFELPDTMP